MIRHVGDGNFHAALIFKNDVPGEFKKVDDAAHRVSLIFMGLPHLQANSQMVERAIALEGTCTGEHGVGIGKRVGRSCGCRLTFRCTCAQSWETVHCA